MTTGRKSALILLTLLGVTLAAPTPPHSSVWRSGELQKRKTALESLGTFGNHRANFLTRERTGQAEIHQRTADLFVIQTGTATLVTGGRIPNARATSRNEIRGATLEGGQSQSVGPGDIVHIPPGVAHQFVLAQGGRISYFALKIDVP